MNSIEEKMENVNKFDNVINLFFKGVLRLDGIDSFYFFLF